jgi:hypothetical protein
MSYQSCAPSVNRPELPIKIGGSLFKLSRDRLQFKASTTINNGAVEKLNDEERPAVPRLQIRTVVG